jgi:hypothetical protein
MDLRALRPTCCVELALPTMNHSCSHSSDLGKGRKLDVRARYNVTGGTVVQILLTPSAQWSSRMIRPSGLHPLTYVSCLGEVPGSIPGWALVF